MSIRAIADRVGVTVASIYRHFADKEELIVAACDQVFGRFDAIVQADAKTESDPLRRVVLLARAYVQFGLDRPGHYRVLFMQPLEPPADLDWGAANQPGIATFNHLVDNLRSAMEAGQLARTDPFVLACALWSMIHGVVSLRIAKPGFPWPPLEVQLGLILQTLDRGFAAERAGTSGPGASGRSTQNRPNG